MHQKGGVQIVEVSISTLTSIKYDPLVTDLVQMSNEQIRYILDNANDFLLDIDEEDGYTPEKDKPNFEDWNPPEGGTFGEALTELDKLIESASSQQNFPSESNPPKNISPDAIKIWNHLMSAPSFVAVLKEYPRRRQWALARYFLVTHAMAAEVLPFVGWAPTVPQVKNHQ